MVSVTGGGTMSPMMSKSGRGLSKPIRVWSWIAGLLGGGDGVGLVGLELGELEVEALEVELGEVAGLVAVAGRCRLRA